MSKIFNSDNTQFIVYNQNKSNKKNAITIVFLHGFMSDRRGEKALYIENYCKLMGHNFISFDNFGHGESCGALTDQTITSWIEGAKMVLEQLVEKEVIIVGSSLGGWIAILLAQLRHKISVLGVVGIATAADFTENSIWNKLSIIEQDNMRKFGILELNSEYCDKLYPISYNLITDARKYLLLNDSKIKINSHIFLVHGMEDLDVPYEVSIELIKKLDAKSTVLKLIKDGEHRLARKSDLQIIVNCIDEIVKFS